MVADPIMSSKYVLREGSDIEKRELLGTIKSMVSIKDKTVVLLDK